MEFKELASAPLRQNAIRSFNLVASGLNAALVGSTTDAHVLELKYSLSPINLFPFEIEKMKLPKHNPGRDIVSKVDRSAVYNNSTIAQRQYFTMDPLFISDLCEEPIKTHVVTIAFAPNTLFGERVLAVVTSLGACELRRIDTLIREWNVSVCRLNQFYRELFPVGNPEGIDTFEALTNAVENLCATAFSWNEGDSDLKRLFVTATATGWLILFEVTTASDVSLYCKYQASMGRICYVYFVENLILACSTTGIIKMFTVIEKRLQEVSTLWARADRNPCKKVHMYFRDDLKRWILVTSKSAHVLVFVLYQKGEVQLKCNTYLGNMEITGFEMLSPGKYVFVTITGSIYLVTIEVGSDKVQTNVETVKYDFDYKNYQLLGLITSPNRAVWSFMMFHKKPFTFPTFRSPAEAIMSICGLNVLDAFNMLQDGRRVENDGIDCAVIVRLHILNNNVPPEFENLWIEDVKITKQFMKKLQLKLLISKAALTYQRLKFKQAKKGLASVNESLSRIIEYIFLNLQLQFLRGRKALNPFQLLSGKCMKYKLKSLQAELISEEDVFRNVQENLHTLSDCLLMDLGSLFEFSEETCSYCELPIDFNTLQCPSSHPVPRCSISYTQVPLFSKACCSISNCGTLYLSDINLLKSLFINADDVRCTFCGYSINFETEENFDKT